MRIALGDGRQNFWERWASEINADIASWLADLASVNIFGLPVFISYNEADRADSETVGEVIDGAGFRTFAQHKDMPPGSNFIAEMQSGLAEMGKFCPLYSPEYMASEFAKPNGTPPTTWTGSASRRLIVGFLLKPTELLPLQKQVVYVPLYGLTKDKAKAAIIEALTGNGAHRGPAQSRRDASENASPEPIIDEFGRIDISKTAGVESSFVDDEMSRLPHSMRQLLTRLASALPLKNAPVMLTSSLSDYQTELLMNGASPRIADLIRCADIVRADIAEAEFYAEAWYRGGIKE